LNTDAELRAIALDGLDQSVFGSCADAHTRARRLDSLVVKAVHWRRLGAQRFRQARPRLDPQSVTSIALGQAMGMGFGKIGRDVVMESATQGVCQQLHPVANCQHGKVALHGVAEQSPIEVPLDVWCDVELHVRGVVGRGREVIAAGHQQAVQLPDQGGGVALEREIDRGATGLFDRSRVSAVDVVVFASGLPATAVVHRQRDTNERPHAGQYTLPWLRPAE